MIFGPSNRLLRRELAQTQVRLRAAQRDAELLRAELETRTNRKKLSREDAERIRLAYDSDGYTQKELADLYGVNPATISRIIRRKYYA
ncbi:helix-turn-helix domain-containing protein [Kitasatospora sp. NPDC056184]|uniref:helix-turn-helix domain-containing protein n=1 Tax=Kitasatospora sp. NPDC056184 TaxID=3345738 RepID=UPI0035DC8793